VLTIYTHEDKPVEGLHYHHCQVFPLSFAVATKPKHLAAEMSRLGICEYDCPWKEGIDGTTIGLASKVTGQQVTIVTINSKALRRLEQAQAVGVCAHEAAHVVQFLQEHIGEDEFGAETQAYLLQWVTSVIWLEHTNKFQLNGAAQCA
jgi:hypothetical protein